MGFLGNLDKINTLELFLTDKGKELMLKENGLGLEDLIVRFSLDDADYDYRRSSAAWVDGISPIPDGSSLPFGTDQSGTNNVWPDGSSLPDNNPCWSCGGVDCAPLSGTCWYDMPDVRGDRGTKIINCYNVSATTEGVKACTNVYAFYDVTSIDRDAADAAKLGLNDWFVGMTAATPNYIGKLFHIAVFGERWINTSWYPWNGKLDTWEWTPCGNSEPGSPLGYPCNDNSSTFIGTNPDYLEPVTGLYLQADNGTDSGVGTGDWTGFNELPPNAIVSSYGNGTGGRAEFWTTGCTLVDIRAPGYGHDKADIGTSGPVGVTASTSNGNIGYTFDPNAFSASTTFSAYTPNDFTITTLGDGLSITAGDLEGNLPINTCEDNCCPDPGYEEPGLFGCQDCSPFDNTITNGFVYEFVSKSVSWVPISSNVTGGTMDLQLYTNIADCVKYRGMDRNVLIVDIFDEAQGGSNADSSAGYSAGVLPLGQKTFYNGVDGIPSTMLTETLGDSGGELSPTWATNDYTGYHGGGPSVTDCTSCVPDLVNNWGIYSPTGADTQFQARQQQPTVDWKYSQDLFLKTHPFYENFQGFVYPVVPLVDPTGNTNTSKMVFPLHLYGAIYGELVPLSEFQDNPTVVVLGGTLAECTLTNPYDVLTPVTYDPSGVQVTSQNSDYNWEPFDSSTFSPSEGIINLTIPKGMRNWGWDFNPTVGCPTLPCNVANIFSGGTFEADLTSYTSGSLPLTTVSSGCTECQCLPAVFINKRGPVEVINEGPGGGTNPPPDNPITTGICGPIPDFVSNGFSASRFIGQSGKPSGDPTINEELYVPKSYTNFRSGLADSDTGIGANVPPLRTTSHVDNYSPAYSIDFTITLQQFYEKDKLMWDVEFISTSRYGEYLIQEGDGSKFYWLIGSGYKGSRRNPKETKACISPTLAILNLHRRDSVGVNIAYLRGYWTESENYVSKRNNINQGSTEEVLSYEFCVTMAYSYRGKLLKKTKRFNVTGNNYGYKLIDKS